MNDELAYDVVVYPQLDGEIETSCVNNTLFPANTGKQLPEKGGETDE